VTTAQDREWQTRREGRPVPREGSPPPPGYEYVATASDLMHWRLTAGKRCRWGAGCHTRACGRPCAAEVNRGAHVRGKFVSRWWAYCERHMYGRWIEDGQILMWALAKVEED
jgi:hypothetical protein